MLEIFGQDVVGEGEDISHDEGGPLGGPADDDFVVLALD